MKAGLQETFGEIDIYLFDQLLKGRFDDCHTVLDAGCGFGRNLHYFLKRGYSVFAVDQEAEAVNTVKGLAANLSPNNSPNNFKVTTVEDMPFDDDFFDLVISSAVLHFAKHYQHFDSMVRSCWRVLKPGGYFFVRLASDIGIENLVTAIEDGRYLLPDGSTRYLVNLDTLLKYTHELNGDLFEPIKTTNVQNVRCMTTWCLRKRH